MITDKNLRISEDQVLTINATTALSTNSIDLGAQAREVGEGTPMFMVCSITTVVASAATSVKFEVVEADDAALTENLVVVADSGAIGYASLTAGAQVVVPIPPRIGSKGKRYLGARYTVAGNNSGGTGKVTTDFVETIQDGKKHYASGFSVG